MLRVPHSLFLKLIFRIQVIIRGRFMMTNGFDGHGRLMKNMNVLTRIGAKKLFFWVGICVEKM